MSRKQPDAEEVHRITTAPEALAEDVARRTRHYLVQMGVRVVCFVVAVLTWHHVPGVLSAALIVAAVVLPYVAVLLANAGRVRNDDAQLMDPRTLGAGHAPETDQHGGTHR
ncbi:DUF3099 domain-containing protein [Cellulomonas sp. P22]|uniref:DUF3099 domain-containing protein n=1 Tax=Cellulomonas sp. P22 TaxID=3373189 RepID=UPI0037AC65F0